MPGWQLRLDPRAEADARTAFVWYLERNATIAEDFRVALSRAIDSIAEAPHRWPEIEPHIRRRLVKRFPYSLLYTCEGDTVTVLAIMHHKRHPASWKRGK